MKKIVSIIMGILLLVDSMTIIVKAENNNINTKFCIQVDATEVDSNNVSIEITTDGHNNRYVFDGFLLKQVKSNNKVIVENSYNSDDMRIVKKGIEKSLFTYDDNKNLIREERSGKIITYFYKEDENYQYWHIIGFNYDERDYYYTRDDLSRINGIQDNDGKLIAKYEYEDGNNKVKNVLKKQGESWICTEDPEFIGNINRIRYRESYYDIECDLYYDNRMFSHADTNKLVWNNNKNIEILPLSDSYDLDYQIYCWQQSLLNDNKFNEGLEKKSRLAC